MRQHRHSRGLGLSARQSWRAPRTHLLQDIARRRAASRLIWACGRRCEWDSGSGLRRSVRAGPARPAGRRRFRFKPGAVEVADLRAGLFRGFISRISRFLCCALFGEQPLGLLLASAHALLMLADTHRQLPHGLLDPRADHHLLIRLKSGRRRIFFSRHRHVPFANEFLPYQSPDGCTPDQRYVPRYRREAPRALLILMMPNNERPQASGTGHR